jgi:uncharacterized protein YecT (DUF1311 family)
MRSLVPGLLVLLLLTAGGGVWAQAPAAARIEADLQQALVAPQGQTTQGMVAANDQAVQAYAREIRRVYDLLNKGLPGPQKRALEQSQATWLKYLASQRLVTSYISDAPGSIHRVMGSAALKEVLRHRLLELNELFLGEGDGSPGSVPGRESWCGETHRPRPGSDPLGDLAGDLPIRKQK